MSNNKAEGGLGQNTGMETLQYEVPMASEKQNRTAEQPIVNRTYKDTVFRMLFNDRKELLSLYNACNGTSYTDPEELEIITLQEAIYMKVRNDIGFIIDFRMNLYEHQSTWPINACLRFLIYIIEEMKLILADTKGTIYSSSKRICFPEPKCVVFYNGSGMEEDEQELRLSSHFQKSTDDPSFELKVLVLNINEGHNTAITGACQTLLGYTVFIGKIRRNLETMPLEEAVARAVDSCIAEGILADFLKKHRREVIAMSIFEYNEEEHMKLLQDEAREDGFKEGREDGFKDGLKEGELNKLIELCCRKLHRGKTAEQIAEELEEDPDTIDRIVSAAERFAPDYDAEKVFREFRVS